MALKTTPALLLALVVILVTAPLALNGGAGFGGTDDAARQAIAELAPDMQPWFEPLWSPPSAEVEGLLFALQAALGGGVIGYYFGLKKGRRK